MILDRVQGSSLSLQFLISVGVRMLPETVLGVAWVLSKCLSSFFFSPTVGSFVLGGILSPYLVRDSCTHFCKHSQEKVVRERSWIGQDRSEEKPGKDVILGSLAST